LSAGWAGTDDEVQMQFLIIHTTITHRAEEKHINANLTRLHTEGKDELTQLKVIYNTQLKQTNS